VRKQEIPGLTRAWRTGFEHYVPKKKADSAPSSGSVSDPHQQQTPPPPKQEPNADSQQQQQQKQEPDSPKKEAGKEQAPTLLRVVQDSWIWIAGLAAWILVGQLTGYNEFLLLLRILNAIRTQTRGLMCMQE
jgi:hypothetical protein